MHEAYKYLKVALESEDIKNDPKVNLIVIANKCDLVNKYVMHFTKYFNQRVKN